MKISFKKQNKLLAMHGMAKFPLDELDIPDYTSPSADKLINLCARRFEAWLHAECRRMYTEEHGEPLPEAK